MLLYISLRICPNINTLSTMVEGERFSVFKTYERVQTSGHLWYKVSKSGQHNWPKLIHVKDKALVRVRRNRE